MLVDASASGSVKVFIFCGFQLLIRWSLPRFRSDQLMQLGWQRLLPMSIANVVVTARSLDPVKPSKSAVKGSDTMAVGVKVVARPGSLAQQMYLPAIAEGLGVTFRHFMKNFIGNVTGGATRPTSRPSSTRRRRRSTRRATAACTA